MSSAERPGLARTDRGASRPLRAWLTRAVSDDAALGELALAWRGHPLPERRQLVSLFYRDVSHSPLDPERVQALFATMVALEDDGTLQAELLATLARLTPACGAFVYGDDAQGGAALCQELDRARWECLVIDWQQGTAGCVQHATVDADTSVSAIAAIESARGPQRRAWQEVSAYAACDRFALPLLRFTRGGGQLPPGAGRFATLLTRGS